jgi:hypothetical protein
MTTPKYVFYHGSANCVHESADNPGTEPVV